MKLFRLEILANSIVFFFGLISILIPIIFLKEITSPISVILISVGCSLIATGITAFLSYIYRTKENDISDIASAVGLIAIIKGKSAISNISEAIKNAKSRIYIARFSPFRIQNYADLFDEKANSDIDIRFLYCESKFFDILHSYDVIKNVFGEVIEVRQYNGVLNGIVICDDIAYVYQSNSVNINTKGLDTKESSIVFVYKKTKEKSLYDFYIEEFNSKWNMAKFSVHDEETWVNIMYGLKFILSITFYHKKPPTIASMPQKNGAYHVVGGSSSHLVYKVFASKLK